MSTPEALDCATPRAGEQIFIKNVFDAFHGTGLHAYLQKRKVDWWWHKL